jgi:nicotinamidase-related amidase
MSLTTKLTPATSALLVVDVQEKLAARVPGNDRLARAIAFLLDAARVLGVPASATEQYPQGLGPTVPALAGRLPAERPSKTAFSCCECRTLHEQWWAAGRNQLVLTGLETHVCVAQTALDLLTERVHVFIPVDAVASRHAIDHETALRRLERAGAVLTTAEAVVFEWTQTASHPRFKEISRLVKEREAGDG